MISFHCSLDLSAFLFCTPKIAILYKLLFKEKKFQGRKSYFFLVLSQGLKGFLAQTSGGPGLRVIIGIHSDGTEGTIHGPRHGGPLVGSPGTR